MPTVAEATGLARRMVEIGRLAKRRVVALISDMNQPLGFAVGNALEVREALDTLRGGGPPDFRRHCLRIGAHMLILAGEATSPRDGQNRIQRALSDGSALAKFRLLVEAQGGDRRVVDDPDRLPRAPHVETSASPKNGYLARFDARTVGEASVRLGAGRTRKGDKIDHRVGIVLHAKVGDRLHAGDPLFTVHAANPEAAADARARLLGGIRIAGQKVKPLPLFYRTLVS
jgi:pyrimidine-nucleoside phosphorylase